MVQGEDQKIFPVKLLCITVVSDQNNVMVR